MNRKAFIFILMAAFAILGLVSCASNKGVKNTVDWPGVYTGTIPAADGEGINVSLKINKDNTFELKYDYIGKPDSAFTKTGSFKWNKTGDTIDLGLTKDSTPSFYQVAEGKLTQLDMAGKPITGDFADMYVLTKQ